MQHKHQIKICHYLLINVSSPTLLVYCTTESLLFYRHGSLFPTPRRKWLPWEPLFGSLLTSRVSQLAVGQGWEGTEQTQLNLPTWGAPVLVCHLKPLQMADQREWRGFRFFTGAAGMVGNVSSSIVQAAVWVPLKTSFEVFKWCKDIVKSLATGISFSLRKDYGDMNWLLFAFPLKSGELQLSSGYYVAYSCSFYPSISRRHSGVYFYFMTSSSYLFPLLQRPLQIWLVLCICLAIFTLLMAVLHRWKKD